MDEPSYNQRLVKLIRQLAKPNLSQTWEQLLDQLDKDLIICGICCAWVVQNSHKEVAEVLRLVPSCVFFVEGTKNLRGCVRFVDQSDGKQVQLSLEDVLVKRTWI